MKKQLDKYLSNYKNRNYLPSFRNADLVLTKYIFGVYYITFKNIDKTRIYQKYHKLAKTIIH